MKTIEEYFTSIRQLVQRVSDADAERYEEEILAATRGNLRVRLRFSDNALLEISESIVLIAGEPRWLSYRYHYQDSSGDLVLRYDNAPHYPGVPTHPDHKHTRDQVVASRHPSLGQVLREINACR